MPRRIHHAPTLPKAATAGLLLSTLLAACSVPNFEGPQLQEPPRGFLLQSDGYPGSSMFAHLPSTYYDAWVESQAPYSTIRINGYAGTLTLDDVLAAQDSGRARVQDPDLRFGPIEPLDIDGRKAWGWEERIESERRGIPWVAYRVMVPYDTVSYTIEFSTENPIFKAEAPESLRAMVSTFGVGETAYNWPLIWLALGLLLFAVHTLRQRAQAKAARLRSINLVKIRKKEEAAEDGGDARPALATAGAPGPTSSSE